MHVFVCISHRGLDASVRDIAAHCYILAVFAAVQRHRSVLALCNGPLPAVALDAVHVNGTGTYRRRAWSSS